jgi:hypothetical protein
MSLSLEEKEIAKSMAKDKCSIRQIAKELNRPYSAIYSLKKEGVVFIIDRYCVSEETVSAIKDMIAKGKTNKEISIELDMKSDYVSAIRHGKIRVNRKMTDSSINPKKQTLLNNVFR